MKWSFEWDDDDCVIYDHNGDQVTKAVNSDPPSKRWGSDGIPKEPDVRGAICDYVCERIDVDDFESDDTMHRYVETAQTVLAAGMIKERDSNDE